MSFLRNSRRAVSEPDSRAALGCGTSLQLGAHTTLEDPHTGPQGCLVGQATFDSSESPVGAGVELGVCVSLEDSNRNTTQLQLEAVGKAGFRMGIGDWGIGHEFEVKVPLASERTVLDMLPQAASAAR